MKRLKAFYDMLGNSKKEKFKRFTLLLIVIGVIAMLIINVGYSKETGCTWRPADIHINKKVGESIPDSEVYK